jgi:hypothetical protein
MNKIKISRVATTPPQDSILQYRIMGSKYIHRLADVCKMWATPLMWTLHSLWKGGWANALTSGKEEVGNFTSIGGDYCG